jgi:hypothetical protein
MAQRHWSDLHGILKRAELDARKSNGEHLEAANPLDCLAELFNNYRSFRPQNAMVQYVSTGTNSHLSRSSPILLVPLNGVTL